MRGKSIQVVTQVVVIVIGVALRLRQFLFARSLWHDEATFANGILGSGLWDLITHQQTFVDPIGYVIVTKLGVLVFGETELAFRWIALVAGIAALVVAALLAQRIFRSGLGRVSFTALMSLAPVLVYYSNEAQQYSLDILAVLVAFWVYVAYEEWRRGIWILVAVGVALPFFSYAATMVFAGIGLTLAVRWLRSRDYKKLALVGVTWGLSSTVVLVYARMVSRNEFLDEFWTNGFAPWPTSLSNLGWYPKSAAGIIEMGWFADGFVPKSVDNISLASWLILGLAVFGFVLIARRRGWLALALGAVMTTAVAVSVLGLYPFGSRPGLYLVPIAFLLAVEPVDWAASYGSWAWRVPAVLVALALIVPMVAPSYRAFVDPEDNDNMKGALEYVVDHQEDGDVLVVHGWSDRAFGFYEPKYPSLPRPLIVSSRTFDPDEIVAEILAWDPDPGRTWLVFVQRRNEGELLVDELAEMAPLVQQTAEEDYLVALFDFSDLAVVDTGS